MREIDDVTKPSDGGCAICWSDERNGLMVYENTAGGVYVHSECLKWFGVDSYIQYERQYYDI